LIPVDKKFKKIFIFVVVDDDEKDRKMRRSRRI